MGKSSTLNSHFGLNFFSETHQQYMKVKTVVIKSLPLHVESHVFYNIILNIHNTKCYTY